MIANGPIRVAIDEFDTSAENCHIRWKSWLLKFKRVLTLSGVKEEAEMINYFFLLAGERVEAKYNAYKTDRDNSDKLEDVCKVLAEAFKPSAPDATLSEYQFRDMAQHKGESIDDFVWRLKEKAEMCDFKDPEKEIKLQILKGCIDRQAKETGLSNKHTLEQLINVAKTRETVKRHMSEIDNTQHSSVEINQVDKRARRQHSENNTKAQSKRSCFKCGREYPHESGKCPAATAKCRKCRETGHFARCCKKQFNKHETGKRKVNMVDMSDDEEDQLNCWMIRTAEFDHASPKTLLSVCESKVVFTVDTGAQANIMDEATFKSLAKMPQLEKARVKIYGYGKQPIETVGEFTTKATSENATKRISFIVTRGEKGNLLSYETSVSLGIIQEIRALESSKYEELKRKHAKVFENRVGLLKDYVVKLHIDAEVKPVSQRLRPVPFNIRDKVEEELKKMIDNDIIEPVTGPSSWISPIVIVPKPAKPNEIRICTDARAANKAIMRERHSTPTLDDIVVKLNGAKVFSKFDLRAGYQQLMLSQESRDITAFNTHIGIFRYKRLNFGINTAAEIFQKAIEHVLSGIEGALNISDDIIVYGETRSQHDERLERVLNRLADSGLTVNGDKTEFGKEELDFFGLHVSGDGVSLQKDKHRALVDAKPPSTPSEVHSLLGLGSYCQRFIPKFSTVVAPLREIVKKKAKWIWGAAQDESLKLLKTSIVNHALKFFDTKLQTEVTTDASPVGVAAVMAQYEKETPEEKHIVLNISRSLSDVERRYAQVEREALAIVWACERLHLYLYGREFELVTDNKAVELIFSNPSSKPKARIERWALRMLPYKFTIRHCSGKSNIADYLSRNPTQRSEKSELAVVAEAYINMVSRMATPRAISRQEIIDETAKDEELQQIVRLITGKLHIKVGQFANVRDELTMTTDGLIMRGNQIVIPASLRSRTIQIAHGGHINQQERVQSQ